MSIVETIKSHPKAIIAGAVGVIVLVYILNHSSGSSAATTATGQVGTSVDAATGYQQAQLAASAQAGQVAAAVQANQDTIAGQIQLATIQAQQSGAHDALAAQVATSQINATQQVQSLLGSLSADVTKNAQNVDLAKTTVLATNQTQQQQILANALVQQSANQAAVAQASINASKDIATQSWFDKIF